MDITEEHTKFYTKEELKQSYLDYLVDNDMLTLESAKGESGETIFASWLQSEDGQRFAMKIRTPYQKS